MRIAIDFDGTISEYIPFDSPEGGEGKYGPLIKGAKTAINWLHTGDHEIIIWSCRKSEEGVTIIKYLNRHGIFFDYVANAHNQNPRKLNADVYIDDKGLRFEGSWSDDFLHEIINHTPWWKKPSKRKKRVNREKKQHPLEIPRSEREECSKGTSVAESMHAAANLFQKKNADYGDSYKQTGLILERFYPDGLKLKTADDYNKFNMLTIMIGKLVRYRSVSENKEANFESLKDTLTDLGVYAFMLKDLQDG